MAVTTAPRPTDPTVAPPDVTTLPDAPGPRPAGPLGLMRVLMRDSDLPVGDFARLTRTFGDLVWMRMGPRMFYVITDPDLIHEVLVKRTTDFRKPTAMSDKPVSIGRFLGSGILTADHEAWRPQRKAIQPIMHAKQIESYADIMSEAAAALSTEWRAGVSRDLHLDMVQLTMSIISQTMFGLDVREAAHMQALIHESQQISIADLSARTALLPGFLKARRDRRVAVINAELDEAVSRLIGGQDGGPNADSSLLALLMNTRTEDGSPPSAQFVRDNILTLFVAGHETTANTLTWTFYYLARNPAIAAALHAEVDAVLGGRAATLADLPRLPYTLQVIKEAMRVEPAVSVIPRYLTHDTALAGYRLRAGASVLLPIYNVHHDPRWWPNPDSFDPERFTPEAEAARHKFAYFPFGGGPRICIGNHFALLEAHIILATLAGRWSLDTVSDAPPRPIRLVTTAPEGGLRMIPRRRHDA